MIAFIRPPAVAGRFYPDQPDVLRTEVGSYLDSSSQRTSALGCIVPHAGYMYSGHVAGAVYSELNLPKDLLIATIENHGKVMIGKGHSILCPDDTVIAICSNSRLEQLQHLFT